MGKRAMELAERFKAFNEEMIRFVSPGISTRSSTPLPSRRSRKSSP